jgi:hypothetical protein
MLVNIKIKKRVKLVVVSRSETWALIEMDMKRQSTWERRILRRLYGPVVE